MPSWRCLLLEQPIDVSFLNANYARVAVPYDIKIHLTKLSCRLVSMREPKCKEFYSNLDYDLVMVHLVLDF